MNFLDIYGLIKPNIPLKVGQKAQELGAIYKTLTLIKVSFCMLQLCLSDFYFVIFDKLQVIKNVMLDQDMSKNL